MAVIGSACKQNKPDRKRNY